MHLFGEGLVRSSDNFGTQGEPPTHPELLDYSGRALHRARLVRQVVDPYSGAQPGVSECPVADDAQAARIDPDNRLLWRANRRRLEAEVIRDAMLVVSGSLDRSRGGSSVEGLGEQAVRNDNSPTGLDPSSRRGGAFICRSFATICRPSLKSSTSPILMSRRGGDDATTVPTQALYLMNSTFVFEQSQAAATRLLTLPEIERLPTLYRRALGRNPRQRRWTRARTFLKSYSRQQRGSSNREKEAWTCSVRLFSAARSFASSSEERRSESRNAS